MLLIDFILGIACIVVFGLLMITVANLFTGAPSVPTLYRLLPELITMLGLKGSETVFDLGAGDGRFLTAVKKRHPNVTAIGCEIVPALWFWGFLRAKVLRVPINLRLQSAFTMDIRSADRVFLYLFPNIMERLEKKFDRELRPGTMVVCLTFPFPGRTPIDTKIVKGRFGPTKVFVYWW